MKNEIAYDITHLAHRRHYPAPAGIEKVDLAYARYFSENRDILCAAIHYGVTDPILFDSKWVKRLVALLSERWREDLSSDHDEKFLRLRAWLLNPSENAPKEEKRETASRAAAATARSSLRTAWLSLLRNRREKIPEGATYLNVAQHGLEFGFFFRWLAKRPDLQKIFFIHDLLPLDYPEFWPDGHEERFLKRVSCALAHGTAFLTSSIYVRDRLHSELVHHGRRVVPIFSRPLLPTTLIGDDKTIADGELDEIPYFLAIGTVEPRKNHLLLLNIWREFVASGRPVPKLILVGKRGWMNGQILSQLDQAKGLGPHVAEVSGLANPSLKHLIQHARAVLVPSFAEGFGLPAVDALAVGTPVLASDIPALREATSGHALFRHPLDGLGWHNAILQLSDDDSVLSRDARALAAEFRPITESEYFGGLKGFIASLK